MADRLSPETSNRHMCRIPGENAFEQGRDCYSPIAYRIAISEGVRAGIRRHLRLPADTYIVQARSISSYRGTFADFPIHIVGEMIHGDIPLTRMGDIEGAWGNLPVCSS